MLMKLRVGAFLEPTSLLQQRPTALFGRGSPLLLANMTAASEDAIIRRKLLVEGESGLDDRRFGILLKDYLRWATSDETPEANDAACQTILEKILQCENAMDQALLIQLMNMEQSNRYSELLEEIETARIDITNQRERLKTARVIRKNRQEYHNLAKIVQEYPERQESLRKLQKMRTELNNLENTNKMYDERISLRKKQFHLFLVALRDLQKLVEQDDPIVDLDSQKNAGVDEAMDTS
ncbi:THO complex subunit 7 -like protein [Echinococcus granulosus]|nr:THO complex subunit 7 -like protein [Echinococcus granulosus]